MNSNINYQSHVYFPELIQMELFEFVQTVSGQLLSNNTDTIDTIDITNNIEDIDNGK